MVPDTNRHLWLVLALTLVAIQAGCGTIFGGSSQEVAVSSAPGEAEVEFDHVNRTVVTPAEIELKRKNSYELTFSKEGYETETASIESSLRAGILVLDILFTGLVGVAVDAGTGAWNSLSPDNVSVSLEKVDATAAGPESVDVLVTTEEGTVRVEAGAPVRVRIEEME